MTRLEKLRNRTRARIQDIGPDDALWLLARVDELAGLIRWAPVLESSGPMNKAWNKRARAALAALAALDER